MIPKEKLDNFFLRTRRAATRNQVGAIRYLLDHGAAVDAIDLQDQTAFLKAIKFGFKQSAELLLDRGADIHATDVTMKNCVHLMVLYGHAHKEDLLDLILHRDDGKLLKMTDAELRSPVHFAAENGDNKVRPLGLSCSSSLYSCFTVIMK